MQYRLDLRVITFHAFICEHMVREQDGHRTNYLPLSELRAEQIQHASDEQPTFMLLKYDLNIAGYSFLAINLTLASLFLTLVFAAMVWAATRMFLSGPPWARKRCP